jgi:hypothetical protein
LEKHPKHGLEVDAKIRRQNLVVVTAVSADDEIIWFYIAVQKSAVKVTVHTIIFLDLVLILIVIRKDQ